MTHTSSRTRRAKFLDRSRSLFMERLEDRSLLAAVITVNSADDADTRDTVLTLREAIEVNNRTLTVASLTAAEQAQVTGSPTNADTDTINFNIPGSGVHTISPTSALPQISDPIFINGYSQPANGGAAASANTNGPGLGSNANLLIELDGTNAGSAHGLFITAGNSTVRGLVINRFQGNGILLASNGNVVAGNFIGTSATGDADLGNGASGVQITDNIGPVVDSSNNTIGGTLPADRNLLSGNGNNGVHIIKFGQQSNVTGNKVLGNLIGTDKAGAAAIGNNSGIRFEGVAGGHLTGNLVGGTTAAARNVISGNAGSANILVSGDVADNSIQGNFIGTDVTGTVGLAGGTNGVNLSTGSSNNTIGGDDAADGVVDGIVGAANVISGFPGGGAGVAIDGGSSGNHVEGNRIGTNAAGTAAIGNGIGLSISGGAGNFVGGAAPGAGNLISGSSGFFGIGVFLRGNSANNIVQGNRIGTDATGANPLPNSANGVAITEGSDNNLIGGAGTGEGNIIAFNGGNGVKIDSGTGNSILGNSIFANGGLGIDLAGGTENAFHVTENDESAFPFDTDPTSGTAPNNLQNFPDLTSAVTNNGTTTITGTLKSTENTSFRIEFFTNVAADPSGNGEGQTFVDATTVTTDATGIATINFPITPALKTGLFLSSTATKREDTDQNPQTPLVPTDTSEFSADVCVADQFTVVNTNDSGPGSLRQAILNANAHANVDSTGDLIPDPDVITFCIPGSGVHTISLLTALPPIDTDAVTINGYSQPGASTNTHAMTDPDPSDNAVLLIEIVGVPPADQSPGLTIGVGASGSTVRGLVIGGWSRAIEVLAPNTVVEGCFLGTDPTGLIAHGNTAGVNFEFGVNTAGSRVGGTSPDARNVISGSSNGVFIGGPGANYVVQGNFLGVDATGANALPNGIGIDIEASGVLVGGATTSARNIILGISNSGINVGTGTGSKIQGNFIGTDITGTKALGSNGNGGIFIDGDSSGTQVGGPTPIPGTGLGNVISGNAGIGVVIANGINSNVVQGNLIGTDVTGTKALGNGQDGVSVRGASNVIGSDNDGTNDAIEGNVISANGRDGIQLGSGNVALDNNNRIQGNFIGTDITGTNLLGNGNRGIRVEDSSNNTITGNVIAGNSLQGVLIDNTSIGDALLGNSIFANGALGIDLVGGDETTLGFGVTKNDAGDGDTGANNLQNFPVLTNVTSAAGTTTITGTLNSLATRTFRIEFFASASADPSGFGEGKTFLGSTDVTTDGSGNASFSFTHATPTGTAFTATATLTNGEGGLIETSEFSAVFAPVAPTADLALTKTGPATVVAGTQVTYTLTLTNSGSADAQSVNVSDTLPAGETFVSASTGTGSGTSYSSGSLGTLAAGASTSITLVAAVNPGANSGAVLTNSATASTTTAESSTANNTATFNSTVTTSADVSIAKTGPATASAGQNITYTLTINNVGPSNAQSVSVTDTLPAGETFVSASTGTGSGTSYSSGNLGSLAAGASNTITIVATVGATVANNTLLTNSATVASTNDTTSGNNTATANTTVSNLQADLALTKTGPATFTAGTQATYTLTLTNNGPSSAQSVSISDTLPAGETFVSASVGSGSGTSYSSGNLGTLAAGASTTITLVAALSPGAISGAVLTNTATATSTTSDTNTANNTATFNSAVTTSADISVNKTGPGDVTVGQNLTYTITVSNAGPSAAQSVSLNDAIPANTTFVSATETAGPAFTLTKPAVGGTGNFIATIGSFAAGASATFRLVVHVDSTAPVGDEIENTATVITTTGDTNTANNSSVTSADIEAAPTGLPDCGIATLNAPGPQRSVVLQADADNPEENVLLVTGTSRSDVIVIEPRPLNPSQIRVKLNGVTVSIVSSSDVQRIVAYGLNGNDTIVVNATLAQSATLVGGDGNDYLYGGAGSDQLAGGAGNDHLFGLAGNDVLCGDTGNDFLYGGLGNDTLFGEDGNDRLFGEAGDDLLLAGSGNDFVFGGIGNDQLFGQAGNDQLFGDPGNDIVVGGDGNDKLFGSTGRDLLIGGAGADQLFGETHDDILIAGSTTFDESQDALAAILTEWLSSNEYFTRVDNLRTGGGAAGGFTLDSTTVLDDGAVDTLWGQGGQDWFLVGVRDRIRDRSAGELVN